MPRDKIRTTLLIRAKFERNRPRNNRENRDGKKLSKNFHKTAGPLITSRGVQHLRIYAIMGAMTSISMVKSSIFVITSEKKYHV